PAPLRWRQEVGLWARAVRIRDQRVHQHPDGLGRPRPHRRGEGYLAAAAGGITTGVAGDFGGLLACWGLRAMTEELSRSAVTGARRRLRAIAGSTSAGPSSSTSHPKSSTPSVIRTPASIVHERR